jgi:hypothetical protein
MDATVVLLFSQIITRGNLELFHLQLERESPAIFNFAYDDGTTRAFWQPSYTYLLKSHRHRLEWLRRKLHLTDPFPMAPLERLAGRVLFDPQECQSDLQTYINCLGDMVVDEQGQIK